jgi:hypothetical protein
MAQPTRPKFRQFFIGARDYKNTADVNLAGAIQDLNSLLDLTQRPDELMKGDGYDIRTIGELVFAFFTKACQTPCRPPSKVAIAGTSVFLYPTGYAEAAGWCVYLQPRQKA